MSAAPTDITNKEDTDATADLKVVIAAAEGTKCVRCWHIRDDIGVDSTHPELCARCVTNVVGLGEVRHYA